MNFRKNRSRQAATDVVMELVPLIDVVFMLLIFFVVTTTFKHESQLTIDLPQASAEPRDTKKEKPLEIVIDAEGRYFVNQRQVINTHIKTLKQAMVAAAGEGAHPPLVIRADAKTPHQAVVTAMDAARQLGFDRLAIATYKAEKDQ